MLIINISFQQKLKIMPSKILQSLSTNYQQQVIAKPKKTRLLTVCITRVLFLFLEA